MELVQENNQQKQMPQSHGFDRHAEQIDALTLNEWIENGSAFLIDVRESEEFEVSRIPGSFLVPMSRFDTATVPRVSKMKTVLVCQRGRRSHAMGDRMVDGGFENIYYLNRGIESWIAAGLETEE